MGWKNYELWQHGIEKSVFVLALERTSRGPKAELTFHYLLEMDGRQFVHPFRVPLPVGHRVTMLTLQGNPYSFTQGSRNSTLFEIFSANMGGTWFALLILISYASLLFILPRYLLNLKRSGRKMLYNN